MIARSLLPPRRGKVWQYGGALKADPICPRRQIAEHNAVCKASGARANVDRSEDKNLGDWRVPNQARRTVT